MQTLVQPLQCQVMPLSLLEMPWLVSNHSQRGKKSSLYCHISKVSPQGNTWVHKEGIYTESIRAKTGAWHRRCCQWWQCRRRSQLYYAPLTGLHQLKDDNSCKQMGISNTDIFSKTAVLKWHQETQKVCRPSWTVLHLLLSDGPTQFLTL